MKEINLKFDLSRARNAEHYQFHADVLAAINDSFSTEQNIKSLRDEYDARFTIENDCYLSNRTYQDTPAVEAADRKRDDLFLYVAQTISTGLLCPIAATQAAAAKLNFVLTPYRNAPRLNYASNTAAVSDFVATCRQTENAVSITALNLTEALNALGDANDAFHTLYSGRSFSVFQRATSENMKEIRPQTDTTYKALASAVNALYQVNALIVKDAAKEQAISAVIDRVNAIIIQLQQTLSRAGVGAKPNFKPVTPTVPPKKEENDRPDII